MKFIMTITISNMDPKEDLQEACSMLKDDKFSDAEIANFCAGTVLKREEKDPRGTEKFCVYEYKLVQG